MAALNAIDLSFAVLLAGILALGSWWWRRGEPLRGGDEGYLWYGIQRRLGGESPLRDFRGYEPGRYHLHALLARLLGTRLSRVRLAGHVLLGGSLVALFIAIRGSGGGWALVFGCGFLVVIWSYQAFRHVDVAMILVTISVGAWFVGAPSAIAAAAIGATLGLAALVGLNHALYSAAGTVVLAILVAASGGLAPGAVVAWVIVGGIVGTLPFLVLLKAAPGTWAVMVERRVTAVAERGATNLTLPVPWPWRPRTHAVASLSPGAQRVVPWLFLLLPLPHLAVLIVAFASGPDAPALPPVTVAAAAMGVAGTHHAYSRANLGHLSRSMPAVVLVMLTGVAALLGAPSAVAAFLLVSLLSLVVLLNQTPLRRPASAPILWEGPMGPTPLSRYDHRILVAIVRSLEVSPGALMALPRLVWVYSILGLRSPVYDTFPVYPASESEQQRMIDELEAADVGVVAILEKPLDGFAERTFTHTHPEVAAHVVAQFTRYDPPKREPTDQRTPGDLHIWVKSGAISGHE